VSEVIYHYCAVTQLADGNIRTWDGTVICHLITSTADYMVVKEKIAQETQTALEKLTLVSLTQIGRE
jgi:hypothetical protein